MTLDVNLYLQINTGQYSQEMSRIHDIANINGEISLLNFSD